MELKGPEAEGTKKKLKIVKPEKAKPEDAAGAIDVTAEKGTDEPSDLPTIAKTYQIVDQASYEVASDIYARVKAMLRTIDAGYVPIEKAQRDVLALTKQIKDEAKKPYEEAKKIIEQTIWAYSKKVEDERKAAITKVNEYVEKATQGTLTEKEEEALFSGEGGLAPIPESVKLDKRTFKKVWKARVIDEVRFRKACVLFPQFAKYLVTDTAALNKDAKDKEGKLKIPGVELYEEEPHGKDSVG